MIPKELTGRNDIDSSCNQKICDEATGKRFTKELPKNPKHWHVMTQIRTAESQCNIEYTSSPGIA